MYWKTIQLDISPIVKLIRTRPNISSIKRMNRQLKWNKFNPNEMIRTFENKYDN